MVQVLDKGFVEFVDFMGGDLRVINSAKVSFDKQSTEVGESEAKLINYLMKHRHGSPFEHSYFTLRVKAPLFVVREWQRHRIGSFNEMSGRYVVFEPEFYVPDKARIPGTTNKQGSVFPDPESMMDYFEDYGTISLSANDWNMYVVGDIKKAYDESYDRYLGLLADGVAKEQARMVLPLSLYTQFYWTVNARSLMNFLNLRTGPDAQWEIRQFAETLEHFFSASMPITYAAWVANNRLAP